MLHFVLFFFMQELPLFLVSSTFSKQKGEGLRFFVSHCFLAFFQPHIAGFWREHLLKVFQKFEKIEADATLSTVVEFSALGQTIRFASSGVWNSLWRSLMVSSLPSFIHSAAHSISLFLVHSLFPSFSLSHTHTFAHSQFPKLIQVLVFTPVPQSISTMVLKSASFFFFCLSQKGWCFCQEIICMPLTRAVNLSL